MPFMSAVLLAILMPAAADDDSITAVAIVPEARECVGHLTGDRLSTTVRTTQGTTWVAPWRIVQWAPTSNGGHVVLAVLDRIVRVEGDHETLLPLPEGLAATIEAPTPTEAVRGAAALWCGSVVRATSVSPAARTPYFQTAALPSEMPVG